MRSFIVAVVALLAAALADPASAQTCSGQFASGRLCGNSGASTALPSAQTLTAIFDRALCATNSAMPIRLSGTWQCATTGSGVATWLVTPSSANLRSALTDEVGTGAAMFGLTTTMSDDMSCPGNGVVKRNSGDTAFECVTGGSALTSTDIDTSAELRAILTDETGNGALFFANGNAGTPSAIDLSNGTALPISGLGTSTTTAIGVGSIEIGHASNTTIARSGAGAITVEGVEVALNSTSLTHTALTYEVGAATDTTLARASAGNLTVEGNALYRAGGTDVAVADGGTGASSLNDLIALTTHTTGNYVGSVADGTGIDGTAAGEGATYTPTLDLTEVSSGTWGAGSFTAFTFDAGAVDPVLTFGSGTLTFTALAQINLDDEGEFRFFEEDAGGANYKGFKAPAAVTANTTCTFEDDANFIPDSCVGDGTDSVADGDKGDITVSSSGTVFDIDSGAVGTAEIATDGVDSAEIAANAVANSEMADNAIGNAEMADNAIANAEMADNAVGNAEMADNAVAKAEVADDAIGIDELDLIDGDTPSNGDCLTYDTGAGGTIEAIPCPGAGGGISNLSEDTDPEFGGAVDMAGFGLEFGNNQTDTTMVRSAAGIVSIEGVDVVTLSATQTLTNKSIVATQITAGALNIGNNAATVGTVEMANGTSNTLSASGGVLSIEGVQVGAGSKTISIPGGALIPATTAGCTAATLESSSNKIVQKICGYTSTSADEFGWFQIAMPKGWDEGTITGQFYWTAASGSGDVVWSLACLARSDDDAIDTALGTAQTVTDTLTATGDLMISSATSAITIGGTPAENDEIFCRAARVGTNGSDTFSGTAQLSAVKVVYTTNANTDN